jgi:poly(3-hydroxybutyrate) depolymerase/lysophospholipase L1-like esterase
MKILIPALSCVLFIAGGSIAQIKVACIGNSITAGTAVGANNSYPAFLQTLLGSGYTVHNDGVSATTMLKNGDSPYWKNGMLNDVFSFLPAIITIKLGTNDTKSQNWDSFHQNFKRDYGAMIDTLNLIATHPKIWLILPVPVISTNYGIRDSALQKILIIIKQIASEKGLPVIDANTPLKMFPNYFSDGVHPSAAGEDTIAHIIYRALTSTNPADKFVFRKHPYKIGTVTDSLPYRLFYPSLYNRQTKYPLILTLHGVGESGADNKLQMQGRIAGIWAEDSTQAKQKCFVAAPQCPTSDKWVTIPAWATMFYNTATLAMSNSLQGALKLVDSLVREFPIDTNRLYVTGLSMGGYGSWDLITRYPNKFAAAIPMSGGCDTARAQAIITVPVWTFHGAQDPTVPPNATRAMILSLKNKGVPVVQYTAQYANYFANSTMTRANLTVKIDSAYTVIYGEYTDGTHDIWTKSYNDPLLARWLFLQKKSAPVTVAQKIGNLTGLHSGKARILAYGGSGASAICKDLASGSRYEISVFDAKGSLCTHAIVNGPLHAKTFGQKFLDPFTGIKIITMSRLP